MKLFKFALASLLLIAVMTIGLSATNANNAQGQDTAKEKLENFVPLEDTAAIGYLSNVPNFQGSEQNIVDSLKSASSTVTDPELKDLLNQAAEVIKTKPEKGAPLEDWLKWSLGALTLVGAVIGYIVGKVRSRKDTEDDTSPTPLRS